MSEESRTLLIKGGRVVDAAAGFDGSRDGLRDVLIVSGRIAAVADCGSIPGINYGTDSGTDDVTVLDATGLVVAPGLIDIHVHLREPGQTWKETIASGTRAAAAGGFTTVCAMPNTQPVIDTPAWTSWVQAPERDAAIRVLVMAAATVASMGETLTDYVALRAAGAVGVTDDGKPILGDQTMRNVLEAAARAGLPVSQHAEDTRMTITEAGHASMNAGALAFRMGLRGMPVAAEVSIVERDIALVRELTASLAGEGVTPHLHVQHISTKKALDAVRAAKQEGLRVTCEVMPHHFALNEYAVEGYDTHAKMNPPLRAEADRAAMLEGLLDGSVDCLATDHAPHAAFEKEQEFERAPNGITGLETALGLSLRVLHAEHGMPLERVLALWTTAPAKLLSFEGRGTLAPGAFGDVVVFDPEKRWSFKSAGSRSKSKNTPFDGWMLQGAVRWTVCEGRVVFDASVDQARA